MKETKSSLVGAHFLISPLHSQYEEELDRIRTEGDLTLIKVQTERKKLIELETKLAGAHKLLRERKKAAKQHGDQSAAAETASKPKGTFAAAILSAAASKQEHQLPTIPQAEKEQETKRVSTPAAATASSVAKGRELQTEERLKVAVAERNVELQKLRRAIDETRRKRLDALAAEKQMLKEIEEDEEGMKAAQTEIAQLKEQAVELKNEVTAKEQEFDAEKQAFRLERQRLAREVEEIMKAEKHGAQEQSAPVSHKVNLEQKIVSFEQKKRALDRIVEETNVKNLSEFINKYNEQERTKADMFARIEAQTTTNSALNESIAQLNDDIARLSGADEADNTEVGEKPSAGMMRRIGAIEERIMQFIMAKILEETESSATPNNSDTLRRLRQYQGRREQHESGNRSLSKLCGVEPPSTMKGENNSPRPRGIPEDEDEEDNDDPAKDVVVVHSDVFRQKFHATLASESGNGALGTSMTTASSSPRKNATVLS
ncbi:unnamed protein product [Phytophthora fragariaefolia]|uniref:Unnamed protein product n=1 Tax=Phytophthora fragariaefolia TaxID=1490495 RepID=A0A9W7D338_9STRA|nr:unnamed protein product [Phytophthora fragariaefolia]